MNNKRMSIFKRISGLVLAVSAAIGIGTGFLINEHVISDVKADISNKITSNTFSDGGEYYLVAEESSSNKTLHYYNLGNIPTNANSSWGTTSTNVSDAIVFTLSGTPSSNDVVIKASFNYNGTTKYIEALATGRFKASTEEKTLTLKTTGDIYNPNSNSTGYRMRYNHNNGSGGFRWYNGTTGTPAYFIPANNSDVQTYTVTYNGNGNTSGNVPIDNNSPYVSGTEVTVFGNTGELVKNVAGISYTFAGWKDQDGVIRDVASTFTISKSMTLYAQWDEQENDLNSITYNFNEVDGFSDWKNAYNEHSSSIQEENIGELSFKFTAASKPNAGDSINDIPVMKDGDVILSLSSGTHYIKAITFHGKQWGTKTKTISMYSSKNGDQDYQNTPIVSTNTTFITRVSNLEEGTNCIKLNFGGNADNQIGLENVVITYGQLNIVQASTMIFDPVSLSLFGGKDTGSFTPKLIGGKGLYTKAISWFSSNTDIIPTPADSEAGDSVSVSPRSVNKDTDVVLTGTVKADGGAQASITITVKVVKTVEIDSITISGLNDNDILNGSLDSNIYVDGTKTLSATVNYKQGDAYQNGNNAVIWSSNNENVAIIDRTSGLITYKGNGEVTITASSVENDGVSASITFKIQNIIAKLGSEDNPFDVSSAKAAINENGSTASNDRYYAYGYVAYKNNSNVYLVDSPNSSLIGKSLTNAEKYSLLDIYKNPLVTDAKVGDLVVASGKLQLYGSQPELSSGSIESIDSETMELSLSQNSDDLIINSNFKYNGTVSINYKHKDDIPNANAIVSYSGYNMTAALSQTVTVSFEDEKLNLSDSKTYNLTVSYNEITDISLSEHLVKMTIDDTHEFSACLNENTNPQLIEWSVKNDLNSNIPDDEYEITSDGKLTIMTETSGVLIVTASYGNISDSCVVRVYGDPYITFDKTSINSIVGTTIDNRVTAYAEGLNGDVEFEWSVIVGNDVITTTSDSATATLTFLKAGDATLHVYATDGFLEAEGDISVHVIRHLNEINLPGAEITCNESVTFSILNYENGAELTSYTGTDFSVSFDSGSKYYTTGAANRVYGGKTFTVFSNNSLTLKKIEITFGSGDGTNAITSNVGSYSNGTWTGEASSITFTIGGSSGHRRIAGIRVYWTDVTESTLINNTNYIVQKEVLDFVDTMNTTLSVCSFDYDLDSSYWSTLNGQYTAALQNLSSDSDKSLFISMLKYAISTQRADDGTAVGGDALQDALARYDWIIDKYSDYTNFLERTTPKSIQNSEETSLFGHNGFFSFVSEDGEINSTSVITIVISIASCLLFSGSYILRKKRQD